MLRMTTVYVEPKTIAFGYRRHSSCSLATRTWNGTEEECLGLGGTDRRSWGRGSRNPPPGCAGINLAACFQRRGRERRGDTRRRNQNVPNKFLCHGSRAPDRRTFVDRQLYASVGSVCVVGRRPRHANIPCWRRCFLSCCCSGMRL